MPFKSAKKLLGSLDADTAATLIATASDVALIVDKRGVIRDLACGNDELWPEIGGAWLGRPWSETVTIESRPKVQQLLRDAVAKAPPRWRQVNHPSANGADLAIVYSAVQVGREGRIVAVGRDLRAVTTLQQRLMEAEQSIERDYARLRNAETRYRLLFQIASEAVLIVDATNHRIVEANPAAGELLRHTERRLVGRALQEQFDEASGQALQTLLAAVRTTGAADEVRVRAARGDREFLVTASLFRAESATYFLLRFTPVEEGASALPKGKSKLLEILEHSPDGLVVTDATGQVMSANRAFLDMAQVPSEQQARGQSIERWLGRPGVDLNTLLASLRQHGAVRRFATTLRSEHGETTAVEISAVASMGSGQQCFGFTVRSVERRPAANERGVRALPRSVEQLTELIGRVPLKDLVRETTEVIERLCIEAALQLTEDNRASAAEMLGLSRQSLYTKLRRYGIENLDGGEEDEDENGGAPRKRNS